MVRFNTVCTARFLAITLLVSLLPCFAHAADTATKPTDRLQYLVDSWK